MEAIHRILLAEDDAKDVELTLTALEEHNLANEVAVVRDGEEALDYLYRRGKYKKLSNGNPVVVLLDIKMPKIDGLEVLQQIKNDPGLKTISVVMLTSSRMESDLLKSYQQNANAYVVKPVGFIEFVEAVREVGVFWTIINEPPVGSVK